MTNPPVEEPAVIKFTSPRISVRQKSQALSLSWFIIIPSSWSLLSNRVTQPFSASREAVRVTNHGAPPCEPWTFLQTPQTHPHQVVGCATHLLMTKVYNLCKFEMPWVSHSKRKHYLKKTWVYRCKTRDRIFGITLVYRSKISCLWV